MSAPGYLADSELIVVQSRGNVRMATIPGRAFLAFRDAAAEEEHISLSIALPAGGYRDHAMDVDMHAHPQNYNINPAIKLSPVGGSKHCLGICFDAVPAGNSWVNANAARFHFTRPIAIDINHFQHDGVTAAGGSFTPITESENDMGMYGVYQRTDAGVVTYALGILDPAWRVAGHNFWTEAPMATVRDWTDYFGPAKAIPQDTWNSRSNDPGRISDVSKFPLIPTGVGGSSAPVDVAALAKALAGLVKFPTSGTIELH